MIKRELWIKAKISKNNGKIYCSMFWCHHEVRFRWIKKSISKQILIGWSWKLHTKYCRRQNTDSMTTQGSEKLEFQFQLGTNSWKLHTKYCRRQNTDSMTVLRAQKNLNSSFNLGQIALKVFFPWVCLVCSLNDLVGRWLAWLLAHQASENEKLLAQKKNLLGQDKYGTTLFGHCMLPY